MFGGSTSSQERETQSLRLVQPSLTLHKPIIVLGGALLLLLALVGLFIFLVYVCTHWTLFVQQTVLLVNTAFVFVGILAVCALVAVIGWMVCRVIVMRETLKERQLHRQLTEQLPSLPENVIAARTGSPYVIMPVQEEQYRYNIRMHEQAQLSALPERTPLLEQPDLADLVAALPANSLQFTYGCDSESGELLTTSLPQAVHLQLIGSTGQGKSRQAQSILYQLTEKNAPSQLQLALIDCEGETTLPFMSLPHVRYLANDERAAAHTLRQLVGELERRDRLVALQQERALFPALLIFYEEFLLLYRTLPLSLREQALKDYTTLALRGRKRQLYLFSIGQSAYTEKPIRDAQLQFLSNMAFAVKPTAARSAGFRNTELLNRLYEEKRVGQFLLERGSDDHLVLAPYVPDSLCLPCTQVVEGEHPQQCVPTTSGLQAEHNQVRPQLDTALTAKRARVVALHTQGAGKGEIIKDVWGIAPSSRSKAYEQAQTEYLVIRQHLMACLPEGQE